MKLTLNRAALLLALASTQLDHTVAFSPNKGQVQYGIHHKDTTKSSSSSSYSTTAREASKSPAPGTTNIFHAYGEESRKYRRTVYTHEEWVKHRSPKRFKRNLTTFVQSGIYKNLSNELLVTTSVAALIVAFNCLVGDYQDLSGVTHDGPLKDLLPILSLPLAPFTLSSPSLGLLLVFRTKTSYKRWDEARKNWGMNINHTRDLVRLGNAYYDRTVVSEEQAEEDMQRLALCTWSFVRSMKRHLSPEWEDEEDFKKELFDKMPKDQAQNIIDAAHRPNRALQDLSNAIENLPMHVMRRNEVHAAATIFEDNLGSSERLLSSPVPVFYSRWTARFLSFWLLILPLGLWGPFGNSWNHIEVIPTSFAISVFLFGIEELATQLEEPFTILPMQGFCDKIYNWIFEIASFVPGDNGMPVYLYDNYNVELDGGYVGQVPPKLAPAVAVPAVQAVASIVAEPEVDASEAAAAKKAEEEKLAIEAAAAAKKAEEERLAVEAAAAAKKAEEEAAAKKAEEERLAVEAAAAAKKAEEEAAAKKAEEERLAVEAAAVKKAEEEAAAKKAEEEKLAIEAAAAAKKAEEDAAKKAEEEKLAIEAAAAAKEAEEEKLAAAAAKKAEEEAVVAAAAAAVPTPEPVVEAVVEPEVAVPEPVVEASAEPQVHDAPVAKPVSESFMDSNLSDVELIVTSPGKFVSSTPKAPDVDEDEKPGFRKRMGNFFRRNK